MVRFVDMKRWILFLTLAAIGGSVAAQSRKGFDILAYYSRGPEKVDSLPAEKLTHIIYSFCHMKGNKLAVDNGRDSTTIAKLVGLKKRNPKLKIILSLGGWGGCKTCSDVFSTEAARKEFAQSVRDLNRGLHTDGLDMDWEYPTIAGYPGHPYKLEDRANFTALVHVLRKTLGKKYQLSFAVGGFQKCLEESIDWAVMKDVNRVHIMSYDLINGNSKSTGHHTALYSNPSQEESTDNAVQYLVKTGVPRNKIVIGAAFYARIWENVPEARNGLYQEGKFKTSAPFKSFPSRLTGFNQYWDDTSKAPYAYDPVNKLFATFDNTKSMEIKTRYVVDEKLGGIMFWELSQDTYHDGLVDVIYNVKKAK